MFPRFPAVSSAVLVVALLGASAGPVAAAPEAVRPLAAGPSSVRFSVEVPEPALRPSPTDSTRVDVALAGYAGGSVPGEPSLPSRVVLVAVPPGGAVRVRGVGAAPEVREGVRVAAVPELAGPDGARVLRAAAPGPGFESATALSPQRATLLGVSWLRNQRVASVAIHPAEWSPRNGRLTTWRSIEVEVSFDPAPEVDRPAEPRDPFETVYRGALVNYEQGRRWRLPAGAVAAGGAGAPASAAAVLPDTSVFAGRAWVRLAIGAGGFHRVTFGQLRNLLLFDGRTDTPLDSLRLFAWPGYPVLPEGTFNDGDGYREVAMQVVDAGNDGAFGPDNEDEIQFFALGPSDWASHFDAALSDSAYLNHPFETRNVVFLTVGTAAEPVGGTRARMAARDVTPTDDGVEAKPSTFEARTHVEFDLPDAAYPNLSPKGSGETGIAWEWFFWKTLSIGQRFTATVPTPGVDPAGTGHLRIRMWGIEGLAGCTGTNLPTHLLDVTVNAAPLARGGWFGTRSFTYQAFTPLQQTNSVEIQVPTVPNCGARIDRSVLAWIEARWPRRFEPVDDALAFESVSPAPDSAIYRVGPFAGPLPPRLFEVTAPAAPVELTGFTWVEESPGAWWLTFEDDGAGAPRRRYRVLPAAAIARLGDAEVGDVPSTSRVNLRSAAQGADYLVVYYDGFRDAAEALRAWRETRLPLDGVAAPYRAVSVPVSAVYDQFSGGRTDPTALRSFLRTVFYNWSPRPAFVTLVGDASYDFKNILGRVSPGLPGAFVPSWENGFAIGTAFATDDWIMNVDNPLLTIPDFFGGRLPVSDPTQALDFVRRKLIPYETTADFGAWRNRVMLIADDDTQADSFDPLLWRHLRQTSEIDSAHVPPHVDRQYVYLHKYAYGPGFTKPGAKADIKRGVNEGVAAFNYIGHGSFFKIADETVLLDVDAGTFDNLSRLSVFVAASCDVGKFSNPQVQSLGERLVLAPNGGCIAVISATELALSDYNARLAEELYDALFTRSVSSGQYRESVAEALLAAKLATPVSQAENNQKYQVMGDAATRLNLPRLWVELDLFACDTCTTPLAEVQRGQTVVFRGRVTESPGGAPVALDGVADLLIEDSAPLEKAPPCRLFPCSDFERPGYYYEAGAMFRGDVRVAAGAFEGRFVVPLEAVGGARGRVRAYVEGRPAGAATTDGVGSRYTQVSPGTPPPGDEQGPSITLSFPGGAKVVRPDAVLRIDLYDPSGILTTGHNPQNGIIVTVDENTTARVDVTASFRYAAGSYQSGTASFPLPGLAAGPHTVRVSAADNLAGGLSAALHRSQQTIAFEVAELPPLQIQYAYLFPNPAASRGPGAGAEFVVGALGDSLNALIRIYTVSGKLVRTLKVFGALGQTQVAWDGLDAEGAPLANGTYFYRVQINAREEDGSSSARQKASAEGRFVILNP